MIRVLHCLNLLIPGGVERRRMSLVSRLPADRYEHRVLCQEIQDDAFADEMRQHVVALEALDAGPSVLAPGRYRQAARVVDEWQPHIIHGAVIEGYTLASVVGRWKRVPAVIMEETSDPVTRGWKGNALTRASAALADACVGVSPAVGRYLTGLGVPERKVTVIPNGVERPAEPSPERLASLRAELGIAPSDLVVGSVGRMYDETHKRFGDLVQAFAELPDAMDGRPLRLVLVGDGPERPGLEQLAASLGLEGRVVFAGFQRHPGHVYALMDVFSLVSGREAFGLVNAEAMRVGLPVVATAVGGIPDIVVDGETGRLVPARDVPAIATALAEALSDPALRQRWGEAGRTRADQLFSAERYVADIDALYQRLLDA